jgi:hypothetical protein
MVRAGKGGTSSVWHTTQQLGAGAGVLVWHPARSTQPRTFILRLRVGSRVYGAYGPGARQNAPVVRVQGVDAAFTKRSYAPGESAELRLATDARALRLQVFAYQSPGRPSEQDTHTSGLAKTGPIPIDWSAHRDRPALLRVVRAGDWPSGLYFVRATAADGRVGYAPFIVRPRRLGTHRVAVVLATNTWAAYNFADADGDGWGDSWYVTGRHRSVDLRRPFLDFGVPFRFRDWDLEFVAWLNRTGRSVDFLSDDDLDRVATGDELARRYDLVIFPGHEEYVTRHEYDVIERYRNVSGNIAFLAANNLYRRVDRVGATLVRRATWRSLGRPESAIVGVQYVGSDHGQRQAGYTVTGAVGVRRHWAGGRRRVRAVRHRDRLSHARVATWDSAPGTDPEPARRRTLRRDDVLRDSRRREGLRRRCDQLRGLAPRPGRRPAPHERLDAPDGPVEDRPTP